LQRTAVLNLAASLNIPVIDVDAAFRQQRDVLSLFPFRAFGHYNAEGNRLVAQAIQAALEETRGVSGTNSDRIRGANK
jgi:hypothetical protein